MASHRCSAADTPTERAAGPLTLRWPSHLREPRGRDLRACFEHAAVSDFKGNIPERGVSARQLILRELE